MDWRLNMADGEVLALLDHIKDIGERTEKKLDAHIQRDEQTNKEFLLPLWESHQQRKGAAKLAATLYTIIGGAIVGAIDFIAKKGG